MFESNEPFHRDKNTLWINCRENWHTNIVDAIKSAQSGDQLVVASHAQRELAIRAIQRMKPNQDILVLLGQST